MSRPTWPSSRIIGVEILKRDMNARGGVGGAGAARRKGDAGLSGELAIGVRHHGRAALMPGIDEADPLVLVHAVQRGQKTFPGHAEHGVGAVQGQLIDQNMPAGSHRCLDVHRLVLLFRQVA